MVRQCYRFGRFRIDSQSRVLYRDDERIAVPPKTADLLLALLGRDGELITRDELMQSVWPDTFVEDNNLAKHIFLLRKTLGANDQGVAYIETVPKRGYRFIGPVEREQSSEFPVIGFENHAREQIVIEETEETAAPPAKRLPAIITIAIVLALCCAAGLFLRNRVAENRLWRSVLIVPFTARSPEAHLGTAFTQELAARLRTIGTLRVVSPLGSSDLAEMSRRLGVETVLSGTIGFGEGRLRVTAQLANAEDGTVLGLRKRRIWT
jgi:DNA-binding winged helix-turn-helix (wHTH) protein